MVDLSVQIGEVKLSNPVMPASGTFSYDFAEIIDLNRLGAMVAKTVSREFRVGNPTPRMAETEVGIIQSIGLPGNGIQYFLDEMLPEYKKYKPPWRRRGRQESSRGQRRWYRIRSISEPNRITRDNR